MIKMIKIKDALIKADEILSINFTGKTFTINYINRSNLYPVPLTISCDDENEAKQILNDTLRTINYK